MKFKTHYEYLIKNFPIFLIALGINPAQYMGMIVSHGDKVDSFKRKFEESGIHFYHGVVIYLLSYIKPYSDECRQTKNGWVDPGDWIIQNKDRFLQYLPPVD